MRREQRMNPKCQTRPGFDTFSAKSADLTGLKMRRITRAVLFDRVAFGPRQPGPDCRISNWRGAVSGCRNNYPVGRRLVEPLLIVDQRGSDCEAPARLFLQIGPSSSVGATD